MQGLNLSRWAVSRPTLILFLMLVIGLGGLMSYQKLGRVVGRRGESDSLPSELFDNRPKQGIVLAVPPAREEVGHEHPHGSQVG